MAAIDKIIPKRLNYDGDERTVSNGDMVDAQNVTTSIDGKGSFSVLKNIKGTIKGDAINEFNEVPNGIGQCTIGEVSDPQRGFIYYAVASETAAHHAIYQYNTTTEKYRVVFKDSRLNFHKDSFVKMDVVNGQFQQDETTQTILYFTDNINPPRKINVERALSGQYDSLTAEEFDYAVNSIKAAPVLAPTFSFDDDPQIPFNAFKKTAFQFATQIIYKDGEVSAISPYSSLAVSSIATYQGIEEVGFGVSLFVDNACVVDLNIDPAIISSGEAKRVRLLARDTNTGNFFIVDEFDPLGSIVNTVFGVAGVTVYDPANGKYRFYNDTAGSIIPTSEVDKMYDNVPQKAEGQTVSGNRLMYSNYTEGYRNTTVSATINTVYTPDESARRRFSATPIQVDDAFETPGVDQAGLPFEFEIDFTELLPEFDFSDPDNTTVLAGTQFNIELGYEPQMESISSFSGNIVEFRQNPELNAFAVVPGYLYPSNSAELISIPIGSPVDQDDTYNGYAPAPAKFIGVIVNNQDRTLTEYIDFLVAEIQDLKCKTQYTFGSQFGDLFPLGNIETLSDPIASFVVSDDARNLFHDFTDPDAGPPRRSTVTLEFGYQDIFPAVPTGLPFTFRFRPQIVDVDVRDILVVAGQSTSPPPAGTQASHRTGNIQLENGFTAGELGNAVDFIIPASGNDEITVVDTDGDEFITTSPILSDWLLSSFVTCFFNGFSSGFKSGSQHRLGVVYYDKYNRSGFVNDIGTGYAGWYNDPNRIDGEEVIAGPAAFEIFIQSEPPSWAETFQIVYPGSGSVSDFVQYTTGGAYPARVGDLDLTNTRNIDTESKRLYVSLETLEKYKSEKSTARDYSFTKGDRLRIASFRGDTIGFTIDPALLGTKYPSASDGSIMEFEVVGVETLVANAENPIAVKKDSGGSEVAIEDLADIESQHIGTFVVLEHTAVSTGSVGSNDQIIKYSGFDWFSVVRDTGYTGTDPATGDLAYLYPDGSAPTASVNHWEAQPVVEIYSPKSSVDNLVYYEIGETRPIVPAAIIGPDDVPTTQNQHGGSFIVNSGDVSYRPVPCKAPWYGDHDDDGAPYTFNFDDKEKWKYETKLLECLNPIETSSDKSWSRGRAHVKFEGAATVRRFNGITYSDAYNEDVSILTLSSFNASLANFYSLNSKYGAARYISDYGDIGSLIAVQENKFSQTAVDKSILADASGQQNLALSTKVLNTTKYYNGDYGCANHPESVLVQDNDVYFFDRSRQKVLRFAGGQLFPISDKGIASLLEREIPKFNESFGLDGGKIISGYDPSDDQYFLTLRPSGNYLSYSTEPEPEVVELNNSFSVSCWFKYDPGKIEAGKFYTVLSDYNSTADQLNPINSNDNQFAFDLKVVGTTQGPRVEVMHRFHQTGNATDTTFIGAWYPAEVLGGGAEEARGYQNWVFVFDTVGSSGGLGPGIYVYANGEFIDHIAEAQNSIPYQEGLYDGTLQPFDIPYDPFDNVSLLVGRIHNFTGFVGDTVLDFYPFSGQIDDIGFYDEALTIGEVGTVFQTDAQSVPSIDSMVAFYQFNSGNAINNGGSANLDGTVIGELDQGEDRSGSDNAFTFEANEENYVELPSFRTIIPQVEGQTEIVEPVVILPVQENYGDNPYDGLTVSYDVSQSNGIWMSRHTFFPQIYSNQNNKMYSSIYVSNLFQSEPALMFHRHEENPYLPNFSTFYEQNTSPSFIDVVSNASPSAVKVYDAISYEGSMDGFGVRIQSSDGSRTNTMRHFDKREDSYYINAGRDVSPNSTSQVTGIGNCLGLVEVDGEPIPNQIQMDSSLIGIPIMGGLDSVIKKIDPDSQTLVNIGPSPEVEVSVVGVLEGGIIETLGNVSESIAGSQIVIVTPSAIDGDSIRGHYALIKLSNTSNVKYEVYCVNAHVTLSNLNHSR